MSWGMLSSACSSSLHLLPWHQALDVGMFLLDAPCMLHQGHVESSWQLLLASGVPRCEGSAEPGQGSSSMAPSAGSSFPKKNKAVGGKTKTPQRPRLVLSLLEPPSLAQEEDEDALGRLGGVFPCG